MQIDEFGAAHIHAQRNRCAAGKPIVGLQEDARFAGVTGIRRKADGLAVSGQLRHAVGAAQHAPEDGVAFQVFGDAAEGGLPGLAIAAIDSAIGIKVAGNADVDMAQPTGGAVDADEFDPRFSDAQQAGGFAVGGLLADQLRTDDLELGIGRQIAFQRNDDGALPAGNVDGGGNFAFTMVVLLDVKNRVLCCEDMFRGSLTETSVYPREIVKVALAANAAAAIFAHDHPSGVSEPSRADELLTRQLKAASALVDVKVLDHFVIAGDEFISFAERGLL